MPQVCMRHRTVFVRYSKCFACGVEKAVAARCGAGVQIPDIFYMFTVLRALEERPFFYSRTGPARVDPFCLTCFERKKKAPLLHARHRYVERAQPPRRSADIVHWLEQRNLLTESQDDAQDDKELRWLLGPPD